MPPTISTSVMPAAITASAGMRLASAAKVRELRKMSLNRPKSRTSPSQIAEHGQVFGELCRLERHESTARLPGQMATERGLRDLFLGPSVGHEFSGDPSLRHHEQAIADRHQFEQSLDTTTMALPSRGQLPQQLVDRVSRRDVDAPRRLVEQQDAAKSRSSQRARTTFCWLPPTARPRAARAKRTARRAATQRTCRVVLTRPRCRRKPRRQSVARQPCST